MGKKRLTFNAVGTLVGDFQGREGSRCANAPADGQCLRALDDFKDDILLLDGDGVITRISGLVRQRLGDVTGKPCFVLCGCSSYPTEKCMVHAAITGREAEACVTEVAAADGDSTYIETSVQLFHAENSQEVHSIALVRRDITGRIWLQRGLEEMSRKLAETERELTGKTSALNELLTRLQREKKDVATRVRDNIERTILPVLSQLRNRLDQPNQAYVQTLLALLDDVTSTFVDRLESRFGRLTPRELEICNLVRNGLSSKEIAALLHRSEGTVRQQRKQIRRKFGIAGDATNLSLFLRSLGSDDSRRNADSTFP